MVLAATVCAFPAAAGSIALEWDPVSHPGLSGYRIYWGQAPGDYGNHIDLGTQTSVTLFGLATCSTYHLAVKARTSDGVLSPVYSNEVSGWTRPELAAVVPSIVPRDQVATLTIQGESFMPGAQVLFSDPAIAVLATRVDACGQVAVDVSIGAGASVGPTAFEVINPDGVFAYASALLQIEENTDDGIPTISGVGTESVGDTAATVVWTTDEPGDGAVFVRESGTTDYLSWPEGAGQLTAHSVRLHGLKPDTTYEFNVRSENGEGGGMTSSDATFRTFPNDFDYIRVEAEAGTPPAAQSVTTSGGAFAGKLVRSELLGDGLDPAAFHRLGVHVPTDGNWQVWLRVRGDGVDTDGWFVGIDGSIPVEVRNASYGAWEWRPAGSFGLDEGLHTIDLAGLGPGTRVDRVLLTDDPFFLPSERPTANTNPPAPVADLAAEPGNGRVLLIWTSPDIGDLRRVVVRYRDDGVAPQSPADGLPVTVVTGVPGGTQNFAHSGVANGVELTYGVFAVDVAGNASSPATIAATPTAPPPLPPVTGLHRTDTK